MKVILFLTIIVASILQAGEKSHVTIGNRDFNMSIEAYDLYDSKGKVMKLYNEENGTLTLCLSLVLEDTTGDCADKSIQEGAYKINGTQLTLYRFWDRQGRAYDAPYGAQIQVYELQPNGMLKSISSRLYIETQHKNYDKSSGMQYLFKAPKNKNEKEALFAYIHSVEKQYKGKFIFGEDALNLISEVKEALMRKKKAVWH